MRETEILMNYIRDEKINNIQLSNILFIGHISFHQFA